MKKIMSLLIIAVMLFTACEKSSPQQIAPAEEFNGVMFGMTKEEVINVIGNQPDDTDDDSITYENEMYFNISNTEVHYIFADDGELDGVIIYFSLTESTQEENPVDFDLVKNELLKRYPEAIFTYVKNEDNYFSFQTDNRVVILDYDDFLNHISVTIADIEKMMAEISQYTAT